MTGKASHRGYLVSESSTSVSKMQNLDQVVHPSVMYCPPPSSPFLLKISANTTNSNASTTKTGRAGPRRTIAPITLSRPVAPLCRRRAPD
jgi:hypothetical protein